MVNYDEIGRILLKYGSFRTAEDLIEQLRALIGSGRHPGAACHELMGLCDDWEKIAAEEPIKGWLQEHRSSIISRFLALPPIDPQIYEERTTKFIVQARAPMPSLGPKGRGILLTGAGGGRPLILSRADALAMMEALALGLMLMEKLR